MENGEVVGAINRRTGVCRYWLVHLIAMFAAICLIFCLEWIIPTGSEGGWLSRIYFGIIFGTSAFANLILFVLAVLNRGLSRRFVAVRFVIAISPLPLFVWASL